MERDLDGCAGPGREGGIVVEMRDIDKVFFYL